MAPRAAQSTPAHNSNDQSLAQTASMVSALVIDRHISNVKVASHGHSAHQTEARLLLPARFSIAIPPHNSHYSLGSSSLGGGPACPSGPGWPGAFGPAPAASQQPLQGASCGCLFQMGASHTGWRMCTACNTHACLMLLPKALLISQGKRQAMITSA